jgi:hypothetical protein
MDGIFAPPEPGAGSWCSVSNMQTKTVTKEEKLVDFKKAALVAAGQ